MTILTDEFMQQELDYLPMVENKQVMYKDYYEKICQHIFTRNAFRLSRKAIEFWLENGYCEKAPYYKCAIKEKEDREFYFKRAMGLQIIYDASNGRNTITNERERVFDICRESEDCLNIIGLIQPVRW